MNKSEAKAMERGLKEWDATKDVAAMDAAVRALSALPALPNRRAALEWVVSAVEDSIKRDTVGPDKCLKTGQPSPHVVKCNCHNCWTKLREQAAYVAAGGTRKLP